MIPTELPSLASEYVRAINEHDPAAFIALFAEESVVNDAGREFCGLAAIRAWSKSDIFDPNVTLEVIRFSGRNGDVAVTTKVDGNFDRTGLPNPVIIQHHITGEAGIAELTCTLVT
jgi:hypothetical protein